VVSYADLNIVSLFFFCVAFGLVSGVCKAPTVANTLNKCLF